MVAIGPERHMLNAPMRECSSRADRQIVLGNGDAALDDDLLLIGEPSIAILFHCLGQIIRPLGGHLGIVAGGINQHDAQLVGLALRALQDLAVIEVEVNERDERAMRFELLGEPFAQRIADDHPRSRPPATALWGARVRAASLPPSYTITGDMTHRCPSGGDRSGALLIFRLDETNSASFGGCSISIRECPINDCSGRTFSR
jgi:hypothetical protein